MAKSIKNAVKNKNDELYTPKILADSIKPFLSKFISKNLTKSLTIWCPFDTEQSEIYKTCLEVSNMFENVKVITTHICNGDDFFKLEPPAENCIVISNPPFSRKLDVFKKLAELKLPFALIINMMILNYNEINNFLCDNFPEKSLIIVDKKVSFDGNTSAFNCSWLCNEFTDKGLNFVHLENDNRGKNFKPSSMLLEFKGGI
jgi:hypothetical protein